MKHHYSSPLPDGNAELHKLFGKSNKPEAIDNIKVEVNVKEA